MKDKRFEASFLEKVCVHGYTILDIPISILFNIFVFCLNEGENFGYVDINKKTRDKILNYEKLVGTYQNGNPKHEGIRADMSNYYCGELAISTAKLFGRIQ